MYTTYYGLKTKPFSIVPDPNVLFLSKTHENALAYIEYGLSEKVGFILLTGEVGIGKTTLIRHMLNKMPSQMDIAVIFNTNFSSDQLFRRILSEFELPCDTADKSLHLETLYHFLIEQFARGRNTLLVIDEAQNLSDEVLEDIRMLFNLQTDNHILLQIILVGQTDLKRRMNAPNLRQLAQRIVVNYHLTPLNDEQTYQYINYRLKVAGATQNLFSPEAMALIFEKSAGIPRTINLLCDAGLVYGYGENRMLIGRDIIESVLKDRICLTSVTQEQPAPTNTAAPLDAPTAAGLMDRMAAVEAALADVQFRQEKFMQDIRAELDKKLLELKTASLHDKHYNQVDAQTNALTDSYAFTDSAADHALAFEDDQYPHPSMESGANHPFAPIHRAPKPSLRKTFRKKIVPYLDISYTWARRALFHKYAIWAFLLMVSLFGAWAMIGGEKTRTQRYASRNLDASPPPELVSMSYEEISPSLEIKTDHQNKNTTPPPTQKEDNVVIHTIQSGETLLSIAKQYRVSATVIKKNNNLKNSHLIYVGQTLKIPSPLAGKDKKANAK